MTKAGTTRRKGKRLVFERFAVLNINGDSVDLRDVFDLQFDASVAAAGFYQRRAVPCTVTVRVPAGKGKR